MIGQISTLNHLYNNGIIDYVPYDIYQPAPMQQYGMGYGGQYGQLVQQYANPNANPLVQQYANPNVNPLVQQYSSSYLQQAQQGNLYNTYTSDSFVRQNLNPQPNQYSFVKNAFGVDVNSDNKSFRQSILDEANSTNNDVNNPNTKKSSNYVKGLIAGGIMLTTLICILKGKKPKP